MTYPIIPVNHSSQDEYLGTKKKFWFDPSPEDKYYNTKLLCKIGRGKGESWAEKLTCEIAKIIGLPCAEYELATYNDDEGIEHSAIVTPSFIPSNAILIHGNEVLSQSLDQYPKEKAFEEKQYQLYTVLHLLLSHDPVLPPLGWEESPKGDQQTILDLFIAYLMFDCLIGNQDRHDQNWGYIVNIDTEGKGTDIRFAPTFDHASSLACRLSEEEKSNRLSTKDQGYSVQHFASKARTPFFSHEKKRLTTFECFNTARAYLETSKIISDQWINRLSLIDRDILEKLFQGFPDNYISPISKDFTIALILSNKQRIQQVGT